VTPPRLCFSVTAYADRVDDDLPLLHLAGLDPVSEAVYLHLLTRGRAGAAEIAADFSLDAIDAASRLEAMRDLGLVSLLEGEAREYSAVDPRFSLRAIADRMSDQVSRIRDQIPMFAEFYGQAPAHDAENAGTTVLSDPNAVAGWYARLQHEAKHELLSFDRPPYVSASFDPYESVVLARGVDWRAIYTIASFDEGATWDEVAELARQGEQARITAELPIKLVIVDGRTALVSLGLEPGRVDALVTHSLALVAALRELFEFHWARSLPLPAARDRFDAAVPPTWGPRDSSLRGATVEEQALLALIATGAKDDVIARQLGISPRTLRRRSQDLLAELGASNRFQAGVEASRRGWV